MKRLDLEIELTRVCSYLEELGSVFSCSFFTSPSCEDEAGPLAMLYMMQTLPEDDDRVLEIVNDESDILSFVLENSRGVFSAWTK